MTASAPAEAPLRVAVWGLGRHARRRVIPAVVACARTELAGVSTRSDDVRTTTSREHGCRGWSDPDAMLASPEVDVVYLATPIGLHAEHGHRVLDAGKHLWCEKSMTPALSSTLGLLAKARATGRMACEAFMYRYHPQFQRLREASPDIGELVSLSCRFGLPALDEPGFRNSRSAGGGALLDVGCYPLDLAAAMLDGNLEVVAAACSTPNGSEVDMNGYAVVVAPSGARATLEWGYGLGYRNEVQLWGRTGSVYADRIFSKLADHEPVLEVGDRQGQRRRVAVPAADSFVCMLEAFARATTDAAERSRLHAEAERQARLVDAVRTRSGLSAP